MLGLSLHSHFTLPGLSSDSWRLRSTQLPIGFHEFSLDFDSTLGFPGEGPFPPCHSGFLVAVTLLILSVDCVAGASHGLEPRNHQDATRAERRGSLILEAGRPVLQVTRNNRAKLLEVFSLWCRERQFDFSSLLRDATRKPEELCKVLVAYGQDLFSGGRPYNHYAETINAIGARVPAARRLLTGAWDFAFTWLREEPFEHHLACPPLIFLALVTTALMWGWPSVAGVISISWCALTRIGEVTSAFRRDLVLPSDVGFATASILFRIQEPKTRFRAARHQVAKTDYADMIDLISGIFRDLRPGQRLWPFSGQTLRTRFRQLLQALQLPTESSVGDRALDLGSLRAGGATHLLALTEDSELVRRRGRWISAKTMEIYLQEAAAITFFPSLLPATQDRIIAAASAFPKVKSQALMFLRCSIPSATWWRLFTDESDGLNVLKARTTTSCPGNGSEANRRRPKEVRLSC